jgi:RNA polymerase sigma-70 factor (ECF subfamily)
MDATHEQALSEAELLAAVAAGDRRSFEQLYRIYEARVFNYIRTFVSDRAVADEVLVEVMVSVWQGAKTFRHISRVSTWILGIARHKALDAVRRTGRQQHGRVDLEEIADVADPADGPAEDADQRKLAALTRQALAKLSREHEEIIRLAFYEELPYEEISALLDIPVNTVKTRVFYAKRQLKQHVTTLMHGESCDA